ncbi:MAG: hypothetical protein FWC46_05935 [Actinomycetia bacterium]|nr:hypothetical protein [Actinomycetes bacterium]
MDDRAGFRKRWLKAFALIAGADVVIVGILVVMSRYGGLGEIRNLWLVIVILVAGSVGYATLRASRPYPGQDATPPPVAVARIDAPLERKTSRRARP